VRTFIGSIFAQVAEETNALRPRASFSVTSLQRVLPLCSHLQTRATVPFGQPKALRVNLIEKEHTGAT